MAVLGPMPDETSDLTSSKIAHEFIVDDKEPQWKSNFEVSNNLTTPLYQTSVSS